MGRRTITGYKITVNVRNKPDELYSPCDIGGDDLADIFEDWCRSFQKDGIVEVHEQTHVRVDNVIRYNESIVLVDVSAGKSGEEGSVYDISDGASKFDLNDHHVPTSQSRAVLLCPRRGKIALLFTEFSARSSGASMLLTQFVQWWQREGSGKGTFKKNRLIISDSQLDSLKVTEIEARRVKKATDIASGKEVTEGVLSSIFKPKKMRQLGIDFFRRARNDPKAAYAILELGDVKQDEELVLYLSIEVDGRGRKVQMDRPDDGLYFREVLNEQDEKVYSDREIIKYCCDEAVFYLDAFGYEWDRDWDVKDR